MKVDEEDSRDEKVSWRDGQTAYKRQLAYARLGIKPEEVTCVLFLRADLRRIARQMSGASRYCPPSPMLFTPV